MQENLNICKKSLKFEIQKICKQYVIFVANFFLLLNKNYAKFKDMQKYSYKMNAKVNEKYTKHAM